MAPYDTIVIGLGCAGVTAASTLAKAGKKVLGLEAENRIGGRIKTVPFGDGFIEEGAEWIHGTVESRTYNTAMEHKIPLEEQLLIFEVFKSDGNKANDDIMNEIIAYCFEEVDKPPKDFKGGLGDYISKCITDYVKESHPKLYEDKHFITELLNLLKLMVSGFEACNDWNDVSTNSKFEELDGHQHVSWHKIGYKTLFDLLLNTHNNGPGLPGLDIKLNTPVKQIIWPQNNNEDVRVLCDDGNTYTAKNVIVTVSLGVLQANHKTLFSPALPVEKVSAIESMTMGVMDKIVFNFPKSWWPQQGWFYGFLWNSEDRAKVADEDYWTTQIFAASNPMGCPTALTFWTSGEVGKLVEKLPEDVLKRKCMNLLKQFTGKTYDIPEPTNMLRSTWFSNPYTRGSYSFDGRNADSTARERLAAPLRDASGSPRVLFAGEATEEYRYSTAHGACDSGYREAQNLLSTS